MRAVCLLLLAACSFTPGPFRAGDAAPDPSGDAGDGAMPPDGGPTACVQSWLLASGPTFGTPRRIDELSTATGEGDPFVSRDGLRMYFARGGDIYLSTRASLTATWGTPVVDDELSSPQSDSKVSMTDDELTAFLTSSRAGSSSDVWRGTRQAVDGSWTFDRIGLATVNATGDAQYDPHISGDGRELYFAPAGGNVSVQHIWVATRASAADAFGDPVELSINSTVTDNDPTLTLDGRVLVWASNRTGDRGLWYATRADASQLWGTPAELTELNTTDSEDGAHVSADGCHLYFSSDRAGGEGGDDLYVVDVM